MSLKTFFTRSFEVYASDSDNGVTTLTVVNHHDDETVTGVVAELDLGKHLSTETPTVQIGDLAPGQHVEFAKVTFTGDEDAPKEHNIKVKFAGLVGGEDLDKETLVCEARF